MTNRRRTIRRTNPITPNSPNTKPTPSTKYIGGRYRRFGSRVENVGATRAFAGSQRLKLRTNLRTNLRKTRPDAALRNHQVNGGMRRARKENQDRGGETQND